MSLRVFAEQGNIPLAAGVCIDLDCDESHYLRRVRRAKDGSLVDVFIGQQLWSAEVIGGDAQQSKLRLQAPKPLSHPPRNLILLLSMIEPNGFFDILKQSCELGVNEIILIQAERSQNIIPNRERMERVLKAAQRQCGRPNLPWVRGPFDLPMAIQEHSASANLASFFAWEALQANSEAKQELSLLTPEQTVRFFVGPEGGITAGEATLLQEAGFLPLSLGPWTLRTETAVLVGLTRLMFAP